MATISNGAAEARGFWGDTRTLTTRKSKEGATQTFTRGRFLEDINTGFLQLRATDNNGDIVGVAQKAGGNGTAAGDKSSEYHPMVPGLLLEMNMLEAADAAHVLAQTDLWVGMQYQATSTFETISTTTTTPRLFVVEIELDAGSVKGVIGDSNARVWAVPTGSLCAITPDA